MTNKTAKRWSNKDKEKLKILYPNTSKKMLLKEFNGRTFNGINYMANSLGIFRAKNFRSESDLSKLLEDSYETYYWIGFLMADGHIHHKKNKFKLKLNLSAKDEEHIKKFAKYIKVKNIYYDSRKTNFGSDYYMYHNCTVTAGDSVNIPKIIEKYDFKPSKTYNPPNLSYLDNNFDYFISFLIGFIDGDGSVIKSSKRRTLDRRLPFITFGCHISWKDNLLYMSNKVVDFLGLDRKKGDDSKENMFYISFKNFIIVKFLKQKSMQLKLPIMKRKWNKINVSIITKREQAEINANNISSLLTGEYTRKEISSKITNLTYDRINYIISELMRKNKSLYVKKDIRFNHR